ncbi:MAG TPA: hypothetical protein VF627_14455, partial [Abditibacterium sp.]
MKNHRSSRLYVREFLALLPLLVVTRSVAAQPEQVQETKKLAPAKFAVLSVSSGSIVGIDASNNTLEVKWTSEPGFGPKETSKIVITNATQFRREERGRKISDL